MRSLLDEVVTVTEQHNGKLEVRLGGETEVLERPRGKDIDAQMLFDLRRMLTRTSSHSPAAFPGRVLPPR